MLTIPKSSRVPKERRHDIIRVEDPPKFRLSDLDSSTSPQYCSKTSFFNNPELQSVTIETQPSKPLCIHANVITAKNFESIRQKRCSIQSPPMYSIIRQDNPIRLNDEHETSLEKKITTSDSDNSDSEEELTASDSEDSVLRKLESSSDENQLPQSFFVPGTKKNSRNINNCALDRQYEKKVDQMDVPSRPQSEPLFLAPAIVQFRPSSADPSVETQHFTKKLVRQATLCKTPRCARPTKAWLARVESRKHQEPREAKPPRNARLNEERRVVWERLWTPRVNRKHNEDK